MAMAMLPASDGTCCHNIQNQIVLLQDEFILQTKRALYTLLQHHLVEYEETKRGPLEYSVTPAAVMCRFRFARYIYCAKLLYGDAAELLVEELLQHGEQETEKLKTRVAERLRDSAEGRWHPLVN